MRAEIFGVCSVGVLNQKLSASFDQFIKSTKALPVQEKKFKHNETVKKSMAETETNRTEKMRGKK